MFVDAAKAELFKLGFRKAYYDTEDGQSPQKVVVTLMSRPFIAVDKSDKSVGGGAAPDGKRSVGRPPNKKNWLLYGPSMGKEVSVIIMAPYGVYVSVLVIRIGFKFQGPWCEMSLFSLVHRMGL